MKKVSKTSKLIIGVIISLGIVAAFAIPHFYKIEECVKQADTAIVTPAVVEPTVEVVKADSTKTVTDTVKK